MREQAEEEGDVGLFGQKKTMSARDRTSFPWEETHLDTTDAELDECAEHLAPSDLVRCAAARNFDEKRVVVGLEGQVGGQLSNRDTSLR